MSGYPLFYFKYSPGDVVRILLRRVVYAFMGNRTARAGEYKRVPAGEYVKRIRGY